MGRSITSVWALADIREYSRIQYSGCRLSRGKMYPSASGTYPPPVGGMALPASAFRTLCGLRSPVSCSGFSSRSGRRIRTVLVAGLVCQLCGCVRIQRQVKAKAERKAPLTNATLYYRIFENTVITVLIDNSFSIRLMAHGGMWRGPARITLIGIAV